MIRNQSIKKIGRHVSSEKMNEKQIKWKIINDAS
jgi:hypothetical protein